MSFLFPDEFCGIVCGRTEYTGVVLKKHGHGFTAVRHCRVAAGTADAMNKMARDLATDADTPVAVCAALPGLALFSAPALDLPPARQREALEFELPRRLPSVPAGHCFGYTLASEPDGSLRANILAGSASAVGEFAGKMAAAGLKPDVFVHPAQTLAGECSSFSLHLPELDGEYYWRNGGFELGGDDGNAAVDRFLAARIELAGCNNPDHAFTGALLLALFAAAPDSRSRQRMLAPLLPRELRASRYRLWIKTAAILAALLAVNYLFMWARSEIRFSTVYNAAEGRLISMKNKVAAQQKLVTAGEKQNKEYAKALASPIKLANPAADWAAFAARLPENTRINAARWAPDKITLTLQTSDAGDIPALLAAGRLYSVSVTNQNQRGDQRLYELTLIPGGRK